MTAYGSDRIARRALMEDGASDYLVKPIELREVRHAVERIDERRRLAAERDALREENEVLRAGAEGRGRLGDVIGRSPLMQEVFALASKVARTDATVLLRGESGTGKDRIARAIHSESARSRAPFVKVNCGALPETLLESELFGHEKGAFTGAVKEKPGRFATASPGTIFLDEIGEVSPAIQVKLLQVLEEKRFVRVGGNQTLECDVRIVAATNRNLEEAIRGGDFREDLFYRLNVFPIHIPPLRERAEDLPLLVEHFLARLGRKTGDVDPSAMALLLDYSYPGNIREMENLLERATIIAGGGRILREHFPAIMASGTGASASPGPQGAGPSAGVAPAPGGGFTVELPAEGLKLEDLEKRLIERALERSQGNKSLAARLLGLTRRTLYSRLEKHGMKP
jgi:two-component system NtrC family response regulator